MADRRHTREQWQRIVEGWAASGLTQKQYCARHGVSVASFHQWRERLRGGADPQDRALPGGVAEPIRWLPVALQDAPLTPAAGAGLTLVLASGMRLEVGPGFEVATLRRLLAVLQELPA